MFLSVFVFGKKADRKMLHCIFMLFLLRKISRKIEYYFCTCCSSCLCFRYWCSCLWNAI